MATRLPLLIPEILASTSPLYSLDNPKLFVERGLVKSLEEASFDLEWRLEHGMLTIQQCSEQLTERLYATLWEVQRTENLHARPHVTIKVVLESPEDLKKMSKLSGLSVEHYSKYRIMADIGLTVYSDEEEQRWNVLLGKDVLDRSTPR